MLDKSSFTVCYRNLVAKQTKLVPKQSFEVLHRTVTHNASNDNQK